MHKLVSRCSDALVSSHLVSTTLTALAILVPVSSIVSLLSIAALTIPSLRWRWLLLRRLTVSLLRMLWGLVSLLVSGRERIVIARLEARWRWCAITWLLVAWLLISGLLVPAVRLRWRARGLRWSSIAGCAGAAAVVVDASGAKDSTAA